MTIKEIKKHCKSMQENRDRPFKENCNKCKYWKSTKGCLFYSRPIDWECEDIDK